MIYRAFFILFLMAGLTGCATTSSSSKATTPGSAPSEEQKLSLNEKEKIWVEAKTAKIWVNPYVDESGDLVAGHYKYIVVKPGHWVVEENKNADE